MNEICVSNDIHKGDKPAILFQSMKWFLCIWLLFHFVMPSHAIAQSSPSKLLPELYVGSFGNEVLLSLTFEDEVEDNTELTLALEESSGVASNVKIVERKKLSSMSKRFFAVSFDIAADVEPGKVEKLIFVPVSNQFLSYDADSLQFSFRAVAAKQEVAQEPEEVVELDAPTLVLEGVELWGIESRDELQHKPNQLGFTVNTDSYRGQYSFKVNHIPDEIITNQPFDIDLEVRLHVIYEQSFFCPFYNKCKMKLCTKDRDGPSLEFLGYPGSSGLEITAKSNVKLGASCSELNSVYYTDTSKRFWVKEARKLMGVLHKEDIFHVKLHFEPILTGVSTSRTSFKLPDGDYGIEYTYKYRIRMETDGRAGDENINDLIDHLSFAEIGETGKPDFSKPVEGRSKVGIHLRSNWGGLKFTYVPKISTKHAISLVQYDHPPAPELEKGGASESPAGEDIAGGRPVEESGKPGHDGIIKSQNSGIIDVAGMSKKQAEEKLKGMGLKTKVSLGTPASTAKDSMKVEKIIPDIGSNMKPGDTVTIVIPTPFVDTRTIPDFRGASAKKVISKIKNAGLTPKINMVKASSSDQTGKVSSLEPSPGTKMKAGSTVLVDVFGPYVKTITVPDVKGNKAKAGMSKIKGAGLVPKINMVKANSSGQTGRIKSLNPAHGTELKAGATVVVDVYGPYVRTVNVPDLKAFTEKEARKKLDALGLKLNVLDHRETDNANLAGKIKTQSPESGTTVKAGKTIDLVVYKQSRLDCSKWPGSAPLWNQKKNKYECDCTGDYERNNANSACRVKKSIQLAKANCTDYNNQSEARWDGEDEKVYCYCNEGYKWNKDKTACEMSRKTVIANTDCSSGGYYGEAFWDYEKNEASCRCKSGYKLNSSGKCVGITYSRTENDQPSDRSRSDDIAVQQLADDLMKIFGDKKKGSKNKRDTRTSQKTTRKKRTQNNCGSNFSVNGSRIDCKCAGWGFDPKYSQCRKGFSDKYSSKPSDDGKIRAGFGSPSVGGGSSHVCVDRNVRVDGLSTMYSRGYGGGHESFTVKGNIICVGSKFYKISSSTVERHYCPGKNMTGCQLEWTKKIESRERRGNGGYKIIYNNGRESIVVAPK